MEKLSIHQMVYIRRSDGRIHLARIVRLDSSFKFNVTVEWSEGEKLNGKVIELDAIIRLNPHIYGTPCSSKRPSAVLINDTNGNGLVAPRLTAGSTTLVPVTPRQPIVNPQSDIVKDVECLRVQRERRKQLHAQERAQRQCFKDANSDNPHLEVTRMLHQHRLQMPNIQPAESSAHSIPEYHQIQVCVRKRPLNLRERKLHEPDVITVPHKERLVVHEPRKQLDLTKYLKHRYYQFDQTFDENWNNVQVYELTARPLVLHVLEGGIATCFAYGQTGSGKTHTMGGTYTGKEQNIRDGIYALVVDDIFDNLLLDKYAALGLTVSCSFFELYRNRVYDLLVSNRQPLLFLEDGQQHVQVVGLTEKPVTNIDEVLALLKLGNSVRSSGQTSANSKSSRSHAVFQIVLRTLANNQLHGKFSLIDLAGNERGASSCTTNRLTRLEKADINKSLLVLKECIRALSRQDTHLPFRGSKLTRVLRDSFIGCKKVKACMIATISPGLGSIEHTLNTLRYATQVKELTPHKPGQDEI